MERLILLSLLLVGCTVKNNETHSNKRYYIFGTGLECKERYKYGQGTVELYDCTDMSGNKIKAVYNAVNVMEN